MIFYDFEVTKYDWLVNFTDMQEQKETVIINDQPALLDFYDAHKDRIFIGCNNHHYDDYILKGLLCEFDPYDINEFIITKGEAGWKYSNLFRKIPLLSYDVMTKIDRGLKFWEGSLGNRIKESSVDFRIDRPMTPEELNEMVEYNRHDVQQTIEVFLQKKADFDAILGLIRMFPDVLSLNDIGLTKAQISAKILGCERVSRDDEFDLFVLPCIQIRKYTKPIDFYMSMKGKTNREEVYSKKLTTMIAGLEHNISWGGIHAGKKKYKNLGKGCQIWHIDVEAFYPRLMIFHNLLTRSAKRPEKFKEIYEKRVELKRAGKKKEQAPLKIVINGTFGISKSETSSAYDPRNANLICLNGQLMLIDLIEHLEVIKGFELIQSNTDGLIVSIPDTDEAFYQMDDICYEWEQRCNMLLAFDEISGIWEKDVNNYVFRFASGKLERKGDYVKERSTLDYDLPIVTEAVVKCITEGIPVRKTIEDCDSLKEFQMIKKISSKYSHLLHGGHWEKVRRVNPATGKMKTFTDFVGERKRLKEKCVRVYASTDPKDGGLWKVKTDGSTAKVEGTPEHCFMVNDDVNDMCCPRKLDKEWYIRTAQERVEGFGL